MNIMPNKEITESLADAKKYLNDMESMGEASVDIADRILGSCRSFIHQPQTKDFEEFLNKVAAEFEMKLKEAKTLNDQEKDTSLKYYNLAQYVLNLRLEKTQRVMNYLDRLNQKL